MTAMKRCPDCAEEVRSEARKCRYCGYRFDLRKSAEEQNWLSNLFSIGGKRRDGTPVEVLERWGVELHPDESVRFWLMSQTSSEHGYLVVTDRRFLFFKRAGRTTYEKLHERSLRDVSDVEVISGRRQRLRIAGLGYDLTFVLKTGVAKEVCDYIRLLMPTGGRHSANGKLTGPAGR